VIFVSHNMGAVASLCESAIFLDSGRVTSVGPARDVINKYLEQDIRSEGSVGLVRNMPGQTEDFNFLSAAVSNPGSSPAGRLERDLGVELTLEFEARRAIAGCHIGFELWTADGTCVLTSGNRDHDPMGDYVLSTGRHVIRCYMPPDFFRDGRYYVSVAATVPRVRVLSQLSQVLSFEIFDLSSAEAQLGERRQGLMYPQLSWTVLVDARDRRRQNA
jgi:lipopolysaccharide transport system ATP-binding protein